MSPRRRGVVPRGFAGLATLLLAGAAVLIVVPTAEAATTRDLAITASSAGVAAWKTFDGNPPKTFDIDGDGRQEILAQNDNHNLYIFHSGTGKLLATLKSTYPSGWGARTFNGPEAYRQDGVTHVVQVNSAAYVTSWRFDAGASTSTNFVFVKEWERRMTNCYSGPGSDSKPVLVDLDKDGKLEILVSTEEIGIYALRATTGAVYWKKCIGGGNGEPRSADFNLDGWPDVVFASDAGQVTVMQGRPGSCAEPPCSPSTMWSSNVKSYANLRSGSIPVGPGIGQLDGVGGPDIVVGARDSHDVENYENDHALLIAYSSGGKMLWARQDAAAGNPLTYTHPIIADAEGDGRNEVYWADWNTIGHKGGIPAEDNWQTTGPANFYRYSNSGTMVWRQSMGTYWNNKDLALADADGDGKQELLATGPNGGHEGIWYLNVATGAKETFVDAYPWMVTRGPVVADLAGDGTMGFVLEVGPQATTAGASVHVYDMNVPYSALWPNVNAPISMANGGVDPTPTTTTPPPTTSSSSSSSGPPSGEFAATFTIKAPNAWWQEVTVQPASPRTVVDVDVRINNGAWKTMTQQNWDGYRPWTSSYNAPSGAKVEFRATDSNGLVSQSAAFTWLDGTMSKGSVPCGCTGTTSSSSSSGLPTTSLTVTVTDSGSETATESDTATSTGPAFAAPFTRFRGNEWWVQAQVGTNGPAVEKVEVRIAPDGAWKPLAKQDWGTSPPSWAGSYHFPQGSILQMRATAVDGQTDLSSCRQWIPPSNTDATIVPCTGSSSSSSAGTGGAFAAAFTQFRGNEWWAQAQVGTNGPAIETVDVRIAPDGAWKPLAKQDWGTSPASWAASYHFPQGSILQMRATAVDGQTDLSSCRQWIPPSNTDATIVACPGA
jgi:hypothetical protein